MKKFLNACKHDFINDISIILNRFADIENWLNDKEEEYE